MGAGVVKSGGGGGRRRRHRGRAAAMSEINVTPFVDVMLVLMIIFMVAAPLMTVGVPIKLPETAASVMPTEQEKPLTISLTADGLVMVQTTEVKDEELIPKLKAIAAERTSDKAAAAQQGNGVFRHDANLRVGRRPQANEVSKTLKQSGWDAA